MIIKRTIVTNITKDFITNLLKTDKTKLFELDF